MIQKQLTFIVIIVSHNKKYYKLPQCAFADDFEQNYLTEELLNAKNLQSSCSRQPSTLFSYALRSTPDQYRQHRVCMHAHRVSCNTLWGFTDRGRPFSRADLHRAALIPNPCLLQNLHSHKTTRKIPGAKEFSVQCLSCRSPNHWIVK